MKNNKINLLVNPNNIKVIFNKEFKSYFNSPVAYILIFVFLGLLSWFYVSNIFLINIASMRSMFVIIPIIFLFFIPAITMRLLAEEKKSGTFELLTTKPVNDTDIVLGKFLASWALVIISLLPTLIYYITIVAIGNIDSGAVFGGYLGLLLMSAVYVSFGLFASSLSENQILAFILGFLITLVFFFFDKTLFYLPGWLVSTVEYLGIDYHFSNMARGIIDSRNIIYFLSLIFFSLYATVVSLERRKW